jgi:hypothetical protein
MTSRKLFKIPSTIKKSAIAATAIALGIVTIASPTIAIAERANSRPTRTNTRSPRQVSPSQRQTSEKLKINYIPSPDPTKNQYIEGLKQSRILDNLVSALNSQVGNRLPREIPINVKDCDQENAFYHKSLSIINICSEFMKSIDTTFKEKQFDIPNLPPEIASKLREIDQKNIENSRELTYSTIASIFLHESGHMLIHQLDLPVLGKNEDAVDLFAAYFLLELLPRTGINVNGSFLVQSISLFQMKSYIKQQQNPTVVVGIETFLDEHSLGLQRSGIFTCALLSNETYRTATVRQFSEISDALGLLTPQQFQLLMTQLTPQQSQLLIAQLTPQQSQLLAAQLTPQQLQDLQRFQQSYTFFTLTKYINQCPQKIYEPSKKAWDFFLFGTPPTIPNPGQRG